MESKDKKLICYKCKKDTGYTEKDTLKKDIIEDIKMSTLRNGNHYQTS